VITFAPAFKAEFIERLRGNDEIQGCWKTFSHWDTARKTLKKFSKKFGIKKKAVTFAPAFRAEFKGK
jgi:hypothetical protein